MFLRRLGYWLIYLGIALYAISWACKIGGLFNLVASIMIGAYVVGGLGLALLLLYYVGRLFRITPAVRRR